jgi:CO/xanthine dehydrogenase Mo-binding subunit
MGVCQMVAEELDLAPERVAVIMGDTGTSVNQGGASGSTGIQRGGVALRHAAAEARRVLLDMAAERLGVSADALKVENGVVSLSANPDKKVSYGELIGGRFFDVQLHWNGKIGNALDVSGKGKPKSPDQYKVVGQSVRRRDIPLRVMGTAQYVVDIKAPGMVHGRMIRPPVAGAVPTAVDESSIKSVPGAQVVRDKNVIGVVAPREWDAIRAAQMLKVSWSESKPSFPTNAGLYDHIRNAKSVKRDVEVDQGDLDAAFANAAKIVEASYEWPFQSHASMAGACAIVDYRPDGLTMVWTGSQKPHYARSGAAAILGLKPEQVRAIWVPGPGSYGRNDAGDAVADAAVLSRAVGKPVRVQGMRYEGTGWDP